jgi:hypothetical protein
MGWTAAQLSALKAAAATGATRVTHDGKTVEYRSLEEMLRLIQMMEAALSGRPAPRSTLVRFDRGY